MDRKERDRPLETGRVRQRGRESVRYRERYEDMIQRERVRVTE